LAFIGKVRVRLLVRISTLNQISTQFRPLSPKAWLNPEVVTSENKFALED